MPDPDMASLPGEPETRSKHAHPLRVWIVSHYAAPLDDSMPTREHSRANLIARRGAEVTIFAAGFNHATRVETQVSGRALVKVQDVSGVRFVWVRTFPYQGNDWRRMLNMASFALLAGMAQVGRPGPDVVVGVTVHPLAALLGWFVARRHGARFIYEVGDLWPQTLVDLGAMSSKSISARVQWAIESFLVRRAESVVTVLPRMQTYLESRGLPSDHVQYVPNGPDIAQLDADKERILADPPASLEHLLEDVRRRRDRGEVVFTYTGAHGRANRLEIVLRALRIVNQRGTRKVSLFLVGDGPEKADLIELAERLGLGNAMFHDPIAKSHLAALLGSVDVGVVHTTATPVYRYGISFNKLFDYMGARLPVAFATRTAADPVAATGCGLSVPPDDPAALADAFVALADAGPEERHRMGELGRAFAEREHDRRILDDRFATIIGLPGDSSA